VQDVKRIDGSFDALRLAAALTVFHCHQMVLSGLPDPRPAYFTSYSAAAVCAFFGISGYLITRSAMYRDIPTFFAFRALRLLPGLAVCVFLTVFAMGFVSSLGYVEYLRQPETWSYFRNILVFFTPGQRNLPGVFEGTFDPVVNGPLWTLPYEVLCYIVIAGLVLLGRTGILIGCAIIGAACFATFYFSPSNPVLSLLDSFNIFWLALYALAFFASAAVAVLGPKYLRIAVLIVTIVMAATYPVKGFSFLVSAPFIGLWVVWIGQTLHLDQYLRKIGDLSYGVYIYGFPIQRVTIAALEGNQHAFTISYAVALTASLTMAYISWRFVERPALSAKSIWIGFQRPKPAAASI